MRHLSKQIHAFGVSILEKYCLQERVEFEYRKGRVISHWIKWHNKATGKKTFYPCIISVKPYIHKFETKCTGKNIAALERVREKGVEINKPVIMIFVDAKEGFIYGDFLGAMDKAKRMGALSFPKDEPSKGQFIRYYAVDHLHTMFRIQTEDLTTLLKMHRDNGTDENQLTIYDD